MAKRYDQYCPVAHAMSLVGERWAMLVVRELLKGPRRYTDLAAGLPGIGTNILATRLRELEAGGILRKRKLPPPAASTVYELTDYGAGLEEVVHAMARWGARSLGPPSTSDDFDHEWGLNAFPALLYPERAHGLSETYVIAVDDDVFTVDLEDGRLRAELGAADDPDLAAAMDFATFYELASGDLAPAEALDEGRVRIEGDPATLERFFHVFSFASRVAAPAPPRDSGRLAARMPASDAAGATLIRSA
jgi:DNA-binding HxlR family transcriptional regulator